MFSNSREESRGGEGGGGQGKGGLCVEEIVLSGDEKIDFNACDRSLVRRSECSKSSLAVTFDFRIRLHIPTLMHWLSRLL